MRIEAENAQSYLNHLKVIRKLAKVENDYEASQIFDKLRTIEVIASMNATKYCNGDIESDEYEKCVLNATKDVDKALGCQIKGFIVNGDPRGYALKINDNQAKKLGIYRDMGGYGILAPEF